MRSLVIDKTGTLTHGRAAIVTITTAFDVPAGELLRLAALLEQASKHIIAQTIVEEAKGKGLQLAIPGEVAEPPGEGLEGIVLHAARSSYGRVCCSKA